MPDKFCAEITDRYWDQLDGILPNPAAFDDLLYGTVARVLRLLRRRALLTALTVTVTGVANHPKDDLVLATGLSAQAHFLGTRNKQLLKLGSYHGLVILHPGDLLDLLLAESDEGS